MHIPISPYRGKFTYTYTDFDPYWLKQAALVQEYVMQPDSQDRTKPLCDHVDDEPCKQVLGHDPKHGLGIYELPDIENCEPVVASRTVRIASTG